MFYAPTGFVGAAESMEISAVNMTVAYPSAAMITDAARARTTAIAMFTTPDLNASKVAARTVTQPPMMAAIKRHQRQSAIPSAFARLAFETLIVRVALVNLTPALMTVRTEVFVRPARLWQTVVVMQIVTDRLAMQYS